MDYAKERLDDDLAPVFPQDDIICKTCKFKRSGVIGYKNTYCDVYEEGKPDEILFEKGKCKYYEG